jgi:hypothetical protein
LQHVLNGDQLLPCCGVCCCCRLTCPNLPQYFLKHEASEALEGLKEMPQKVAGALGTAAEIGGGVLQHIGEKVGDAAQLVAHPGSHTTGTQARQERTEVRGVEGIEGPGQGRSWWSI